MRFWIFSLLCGLTVCGPSLADGLFYRLPADGTSARYALEMTMNIQGKEITARGTMTMSSVGQVTVKDKKCRWLEVKMQVTVMDKEDLQLYKVLIAQEHLQPGKNPLEHAIKGFMKRGKGEPAEIKDFKSGKTPLPLFLAGPLKETKKLAKEVIDGKLGKLECEGVRGTQELEKDKEKIHLTYETRLHDKAPFGVVASRIQIKLQVNQEEGTGTITLRLVEIGKGAKSELPEQQ